MNPYKIVAATTLAAASLGFIPTAGARSVAAWSGKPQDAHYLPCFAEASLSATNQCGVTAIWQVPLPVDQATTYAPAINVGGAGASGDVACQAGSLYDDSTSVASFTTARVSSNGSLFATGDTVLGSLADPRGNPEEQLSREQLKAAIRSAIAARPDEERALLERYYFGGMTLRDAARGLSESWASRLHARAIGGVAKSLQRTHEEVLLERASRAPRA